MLLLLAQAVKPPVQTEGYVATQHACRQRFFSGQNLTYIRQKTNSDKKQ